MKSAHLSCFRTTVGTAAFLLLLSQPAKSQTDLPRQTASVDWPVFSLETFCYDADDSNETRVDVYVDVGYDVLHFVNEAEIYRASYEVEIDIVDSLDHPLSEKSWVERLETKEYEKTVSLKESNLSVRSFVLPPGMYILKAQISDEETRKTYKLRRAISARNFRRNRFSFSDLMYAENVSIEGSKKVITPIISDNVGSLQNGFFLFFEAYNRLQIDSALFSISVQNSKHETVRRDSFIQKLTGPRTSCIWHFQPGDLFAGDYRIVVDATPHKVNADSSIIDVSASTSHPFSIRWKGLPVNIVDLDLAIDQMMYIVDKDRLDEMKKAEPEKKHEMFLAYWNKRDPTPGTIRNELMDEYYGRVDYANKHFTHFLDGWKSDMGMVYIIFGTPSNVERHPFDSDAKPYEVWTYYELNRQFVFIDQSGFGDYRLQTPIWDVWSTRPH